MDGCSIPHKTVALEVSEAEAKKLREEAGYSSEGVSGGVIVEFKRLVPALEKNERSGLSDRTLAIYKPRTQLERFKRLKTQSHGEIHSMVITQKCKIKALENENKEL